MDIRSRILTIIDANAGMTVRSISLAAGLSDSMLNKFLRGDTESLTLKTVDKLADALGIKAEWLAFGHEATACAGEQGSSPDWTPMNRKPADTPHFLRQWRQHREMTLDEVTGRLAELGDSKLPQTAASLSRIESGRQPYGQPIIEALAGIYACAPDRLIGQDPSSRDDISTVWSQIDPEDRPLAERVLRAFVKSQSSLLNTTSR